MMDDQGARPARRRRTKGRRPNNDGTVRKRADGRWEARYTYPNGTQRSFYGKTQEDVLKKLHDERNRFGATAVTPGERLTVESFLTQWLESSVKPRLAPKTYDGYRTVVEKHLVPELGRIKLDALTPRQVTTMLRRKEDAGLAPRTLLHIRSTLRTALAQAMRWELVGRNVAGLTDPIRQEPRDVKVITETDARRILDQLTGHRWRAAFILAMVLGLRQGEVLGLHWTDVDLAARTVRIRLTLQRVSKQLILKPPKTEKSRRLLHLPAVVVSALVDRQRIQAAERAAAGELWQETGLVFTTQRGTPIEPRNLVREWHNVLAAAGVERQRFHDTRHTAISTLAALGVPLKVIQELVGHATLATTADIYAHVLPQAMQDAVSAIDRAYPVPVDGTAEGPK